MTHEELMEEKYLLEQAAKMLVDKVLKDEENKMFVEVSHFLANEPTNTWKISIERLGE